MSRTTAGSVFRRCPPFVVLACAGLLACKPAPRDAPENPPTDPRMRADRENDDVPQLPGVRVTLHAPSSVRMRDTVHFDVVVENSGTDSATLYLRGRAPTVEVQVERDGARVWSSLDGQVIPAVVLVRTLAPGESFTLRSAWLGRAETDVGGEGRYDATALLLTDGAPLRSLPRSLTILAR